MARFDHFDRPLRHATLVVSFISMIIFPIWIAEGSRGDVLGCGIAFTILSAVLSHYIFIFGMAPELDDEGEVRSPAILGWLPKRSSSASPGVFRTWGRIFKPITPWALGFADAFLFVGFQISLVLLCLSYDDYYYRSQPPWVLGGYCIMMLTIMNAIHLFFALRFLLINIHYIFSSLCGARRRSRRGTLDVLCARCGDHVAGTGQPTTQQRGRDGLSFYAALATADDDAADDARLLGSPRPGAVQGLSVARAAEEYKDDVEEAVAVPVSIVPQQSGIVVPAPQSGLYDYGA